MDEQSREAVGTNSGRRLLVVVLFLGLTVAFTHPLVWHLSTHHAGESSGDARIYVWNLWWVKTAVLQLHTDPLQTDFIFYPTGIGLALHTLALLHGLVFIPLCGVAGDVAAANLILLATFIASALGAYALARRLGAGTHGAFLAGIAFAFCPYRLARLGGHYDLLSTQWLPLYALAFLGVLQAERIRPVPVVTAGLLGAACGYTSLTYLAYLVLLSLVLVALRLGAGRSKTMIGRATAVAIVVAALLSPLLLAIRRDVTAWRYLPYPGSDRYVADLLAYVTPTPRQTLLGPILGHAFDPNVTEFTVFTGWILLALGLAAVGLGPLRRSHRSWIVLGSLAFVLSLGDTLHVGGRDTGVPLLFPLLHKVPFLHHLRAPGRLSILVVLCLAVLAAAVWTRALAGINTARRTVLTVVAAALMAAESLAIPVPLFAAGVPPVFRRIAEEPGDFAVVEIPGIDQVPGQIMYRQTFHGKRVFIGIAARVPVEKGNYFYGLPLVRPLIDMRKQRLSLEAALAAPERGAAPEVARFLGVRYFVIEKAYEGRGLVTFLETSLPVERAPGDDERIVLRVRPEALPPSPWTLEAGGGASRLYFEAGWAPPEMEAGRGVRRASAHRSTVLFRRPAADALDLVLVLSAPPDVGGLQVEGRLGGKWVGRAELQGAAEARWPIPPGAAEAVERLELLWSAPDARIAGVRFEPR
jgi:hypothetical protein